MSVEDIMILYVMPRFGLPRVVTERGRSISERRGTEQDVDGGKLALVEFVLRMRSPPGVDAEK